MPADVTSDTHWIPRTFPSAALHHPATVHDGMGRRGSHRRRRSDRDMIAPAITLRVPLRTVQGRSGYRSRALQQVSRCTSCRVSHCKAATTTATMTTAMTRGKVREREGFSAHGGNEAGMKTHPQERGSRARARASRYLGHAARGRDARLIRLPR